MIQRGCSLYVPVFAQKMLLGGPDGLRAHTGMTPSRGTALVAVRHAGAPALHRDVTISVRGVLLPGGVIFRIMNPAIWLRPNEPCHPYCGYRWSSGAQRSFSRAVPAGYSLHPLKVLLRSC